MIFTQSCIISAGREAVWDFLMNMENVARCLPGVEDISQVDDETYNGTLRLKIGPIALALQGTSMSQPGIARSGMEPCGPKPKTASSAVACEPVWAWICWKRGPLKPRCV